VAISSASMRLAPVCLCRSKHKNRRRQVVKALRVPGSSTASRTCARAVGSLPELSNITCRSSRSRCISENIFKTCAECCFIDSSIYRNCARSLAALSFIPSGELDAWPQPGSGRSSKPSNPLPKSWRGRRVIYASNPRRGSEVRPENDRALRPESWGVSATGTYPLRTGSSKTWVQSGKRN
jgi:hypothetical protein